MRQCSAAKIGEILKKSFSFLVIATLVSACGGGGSSSEAPGARNACGVVNLPNKVINGNACGNLAQSAIVRIAFKVPGGYIPVCTGTMISVNRVLTATHCFLEVPDNIQSIGIISGEKESFRYIDGVNLNVAPGFGISSGRLFNDVSILTLEGNADLPIIPLLLSRSVEIGEPGYVYGYGVSEVNQDPATVDFADLNAGSMTIENITPNHLFVVFENDGVNVCFGDSGGPLVADNNGIPAIVGTVSQGSNQNCTAGDVTTFINIQHSDILNWIASVAPDAAII